MFFKRKKIKLLEEAITDKKIIRFLYAGHIRVVEPYMIGFKKRFYKKMLCAWFLDGFSRTGFKNPNVRWRIYPINKISNIEFTGEHFNGKRPISSHQQCILKKITFSVNQSVE